MGVRRFEGCQYERDGDRVQGSASGKPKPPCTLGRRTGLAGGLLDTQGRPHKYLLILDGSFELFRPDWACNCKCKRDWYASAPFSTEATWTNEELTGIVGTEQGLEQLNPGEFSPGLSPLQQALDQGQPHGPGEAAP